MKSVKSNANNRIIKVEEVYRISKAPRIVKVVSTKIMEIGMADAIPEGSGENGTVDLTSANTWYAVPSSVPTTPYVLVASIENAVGIIRWGYSNSGTPSSTNGNVAPSNLTLRVTGGQVIYFSSSTAGDDVNWTTKVI